MERQSFSLRTSCNFLGEEPASLPCACPTDLLFLVQLHNVAYTTSNCLVQQRRPLIFRKCLNVCIGWLLFTNYFNRALNDFISQRTISSSRTLTAINLLQLLIRAAPNLYVKYRSRTSMFTHYKARMYPHNLRAYYTDAGMERIGGGLELWRGFFQSVHSFYYNFVVS